ncbi:MAG: hypothetical protein SCALA702_25550 [Melioribacteraceae bacterium]|nr:MAG: hypothetical protein SCALA702_25550 [Melioribacteraceae bacterium]
MSEQNPLKNSLSKYFDEIDPVLFFNEYLVRLIKVLKSSNHITYDEKHGQHLSYLQFEANPEHKEFINFLLNSLHSFNNTTENDNQKLMEYANSITGWITHRKKDIPSRVVEIIENKEILYQNYLARAKYLTNEYPEKIYSPILLIPEIFLIFCDVLESNEIDDDYKLEVSLALVYLVSPIDLLPENFINHPLSLLDDLFLMLGAYNIEEINKISNLRDSYDNSVFERIDGAISEIKKEFGEDSVITIHESVAAVKENIKLGKK